MPVPPQEGTPSLLQVHRLLHLPSLGLQQQAGLKSQSTVAATRLPPGELTSQQTLSPGRVSHRPDNLLLQFSSLNKYNNNNSANTQVMVTTENG
jgi:hypothetical protein